jgi:CheY-like chemotaxis protein
LPGKKSFNAYRLEQPRQNKLRRNFLFVFRYKDVDITGAANLASEMLSPPVLEPNPTECEFRFLLMNRISTGSNWRMTADGQKTVLIAEDEAHMRGLLQWVLPKQDFTVILAVDGEEAINLYGTHKHEIDVVLLDVGLPKIGGLGVYLNMKAQNPEVQVVVTSGYLTPTIKSKFSDAGIKYFIPKPYALTDVIHTLRAVCDNLCDYTKDESIKS